MTKEHVRAAFELLGRPVCDWADEHGFSRADVYAVLSGRTAGKRGRAHAIAVALGIKEIAASPDQAVVAAVAARIQESTMK